MACSDDELEVTPKTSEVENSKAPVDILPDVNDESEVSTSSYLLTTQEVTMIIQQRREIQLRQAALESVQAHIADSTDTVANENLDSIVSSNQNKCTLSSSLPAAESKMQFEECVETRVAESRELDVSAKKLVTSSNKPQDLATSADDSWVITQYILADVDQISALRKELPSYYSEGQTNFISDIQNKKIRILTLRKGKEVLGYLHFTRANRRVRVLELVVHPNFRRRGVAAQLLMHFRKFARWKVIEITVQADSKEMFSLCARAGFKTVSVLSEAQNRSIDYRWELQPHNPKAPSTRSTIHFSNTSVESTAIKIIGGGDH
jgi:ribosomal protein S18 acetylase RimI-like enzyme